MRIKLICTDCKTEFSCDRGKELKTNCPSCGSSNITIPTAMDSQGNPCHIEESQRRLF